jgi:hypothetical protein
MLATWGGKESSYFSSCGGFISLSVVPSFKPLDVGGSSANGEACSCSPFLPYVSSPHNYMGVECQGRGHRGEPPLRAHITTAGCCYLLWHTQGHFPEYCWSSRTQSYPWTSFSDEAAPLGVMLH